MRQLRALLWVVLAVAATGCGIRGYPGQPGVVTDGFSKLSLEMLQAEGLYVYEATYDNRPGAKGVESVVTKLYPGAHTFTSNVRTNFQGTVFHNKEPYAGALVQMISHPATNEVILSEGNHIQLMIDYRVSLDEVDRTNVAEQGLFSSRAAPSPQGFARLAEAAYRGAVAKLSLLRAGRLDGGGMLNYSVTRLALGGEIFTPPHPIEIQADLQMAGVRAQIPPATRDYFAAFVEARFPKGFDGELRVSVAGANEPIAVRMGIHTPRTLAASGVRVITGQNPSQMEQWIARSRAARRF